MVSRSDIVRLKLFAAKSQKEIKNYKIDYKNHRATLWYPDGTSKHWTWSYIISSF